MNNYSPKPEELFKPAFGMGIGRITMLKFQIDGRLFSLKTTYGL